MVRRAPLTARSLALGTLVTLTGFAGATQLIFGIELSASGVAVYDYNVDIVSRDAEDSLPWRRYDWHSLLWGGAVVSLERGDQPT